MTQSVVSDNWSLQDIAQLFSHGMDDSETNEIVIRNEKHSFAPVSYASIQTEALFDFLTDIILCDEILVEERYDNAWKNVNSPLLKAKDNGIVRSYPFLNEPGKIEGPRERIIQHMCSTQSLSLAHQKNVDSWTTSQQSDDAFLSQIIWGGAGMCARCYAYEKGYTPHPLRKRFFINSGFMLPASDALHQLTSILNDERAKVSKKLYGSDALYSLYVSIPAIPVRVIQESSSASQLVDVAIEMRKYFKKLRKWLTGFQNALSHDNLKAITRYRRELDSVSKYVSTKIGAGTTDKPVSMEAGIGIFKFSTQFNPIITLKNQFGVRATLNKLIFGSNGAAEIKKFTKMFGQQNSPIGYEIERHFTKNA